MNFIIRPRAGELIAGIFGLTIFAILLYGSIVAGLFEFWFGAIFIITVLLGSLALGTIGVCMYFRWRLTVNGDELCYQPLLRDKVNFKFSDIKRFEVKVVPRAGIQTTLFTAENKSLCTVACSYHGTNLLITRMREEGIPFEKHSGVNMGRYDWPPEYR